MVTLTVIAMVLGAGALITLIGSRLIERAHPARGRRIAVNGLLQHVVELDAAAGSLGAPIVLLHGASCNLEDLRELAGRLAVRHRVILVDRPGQGWSETNGRRLSSPAAQAAILREVLDRIGVSRAIVVGHSFGGAVAAAFAVDYPDRVTALVLLAPPTHPDLRRLTALYTVLAVPVFGWLFARTLALPLAAFAFAPGLRRSFLPQSPPADYIPRCACFLLLRPKAFLANARDVADLRAFLIRRATRYGMVEAPTLIVTGDCDRIVSPRRHAMALAAAIPAAKLVVLPGIGHMPHHADPDRIVALIEELAGSAQSVAR